MTTRSVILAAGFGLSLAACGERSAVAYGDANSIILAASDTLWSAVEDTVHAALEPRIFTVREERTFQVTHVSPESEDWATLRLFRQVLVIGTPDDPWVAPVLEGRDEEVGTLPAVVERDDLWARGQRVTALVVSPAAPAAQVAETVPALGALYHERFREYAVRRMFVSGANEALRDSLRAEAGFSLIVPSVYRWRQASDSTYVFRNDQATTGELIRSVLVTWRRDGGALPTPEAVLEWRDRAAAEWHERARATERQRIEARVLEERDAPTLEVQAVWSESHEGYPMAGPMVARVVSCPEQGRTYLLDAWLYAPGRDKYEYMLQLETILDTFACGG